MTQKKHAIEQIMIRDDSIDVYLSSHYWIFARFSLSDGSVKNRAKIQTWGEIYVDTDISNDMFVLEL